MTNPAPALPELDISYECQRDYGLTLSTPEAYSIVESNARAQCRERQLLNAISRIASLESLVREMRHNPPCTCSLCRRADELLKEAK